ncbi:universal stress protein [Nonomuraea spiralis]|uniref:Universal stress protein n=1 Tax=Nonomuraea spiralis TaxID=46182 RepID=A0ABV5IGV0_9ACTN|nr:universal stress protein [Nonomuraea spiralis]GGS97722.1 universal stress protein [Nonomuraea spiralis]
MRRRIVAGVDGSPSSTAAVEWAAADARRRGLPLRIVHVCEQWSQGVEGSRYCAGALEAAAARARELGGDVEVSAELLAGNVIEALADESAAADSLVLGSRGMGGFAGMVLGSVGMAVAGHAAGTVVIVRGAADARHGLVVVGHDGSEGSQAAMAYAVEQARTRSARLHVVYAWQPPVVSPYWAAYSRLLADSYEEEQRMARARVTPWRGANPDIVITDEQVHGHPVAALTEASAMADLVVLGSRGLGGFSSAVLGSVSHGVLHHAHCPVAVVRPRGPVIDGRDAAGRSGPG